MTDEHEHDIEVRANVTRTVHQAFCSCGWGGHPWPTAASAQNEGDWHVVVVLR